MCDLKYNGFEKTIFSSETILAYNVDVKRRFKRGRKKQRKFKKRVVNIAVFMRRSSERMLRVYNNVNASIVSGDSRLRRA